MKRLLRTIGVPAKVEELDGGAPIERGIGPKVSYDDNDDEAFWQISSDLDGEKIRINNDVKNVRQY